MMAKKTPRDKDISKKPSVKTALLDIFQDVSAGFTDQNERADLTLDMWDLYNSVLNDKQSYNGNAKIFVPIVHDAVNARTLRFANQAFPQSGRYVEVVAENSGDTPHYTMALLEYYCRRAKLRTEMAPALLRNGDCEGQMTVYVDWDEYTRHTVWKGPKPIEVGGVKVDGLDDVDDIHEETVVDSGPCVEVIADSDFLLLPVTANSIDGALQAGGSVTVIRRWSKDQIQKRIDDGDIDEDAGEALLSAMSTDGNKSRESVQEKHQRAAGIQKGEGDKLIAVVYETWVRIKVDGVKRLCRAYYGGDDNIVGAKRNPYWCDRCPVLSVPVEKIASQFKGVSKLKNVATMQYFSNDIVNEGADSATMSMLPIVMTDPEKNPKVGTMVLDLAAVWETSPKDTQFVQFPAIWRDAFEVVNSAKTQIFQTLSVTPAMMPQQASKNSKRSQAEAATEMQADILSTSDAVVALEEGILTPLLQRFAEYDAQFRDEDILIKSFGEMGLKATMEEIPPSQANKRYEYRWYGVEATRDASRIQQQIAFMNVLRGIPPNLYEGYKLNMVPMIQQGVDVVFGPRIAPAIFQDIRDGLAVNPETENKMLEMTFDVAVHPLDDDPKHIEAHLQALELGDESGQIRAHIEKHKLQMSMKTRAMLAQAGGGQQPGGGLTSPGTPGGGAPQPRPGIAGVPSPQGGAAPRIGAQPAMPRLMKQAPGAIPPDSMVAAGAVNMPRRA